MSSRNESHAGVRNSGAEPIADIDADNQDEDDGEGVEMSWEVREINDMRRNKDTNELEFHVVWDLDSSTSWEPQTNFPEELQHERVLDFRSRHPKKYASVLKKSENCSKWSYEKIDEDAYEKQDGSAPREARQLADPNRLADIKEQLIKTFDDGGRVSRSKTQAIIRNIESAKSSTSSVRSTTSKEPTDTKKENRGKQKKKSKPVEFGQGSSVKNEPAAKKKKSDKEAASEKKRQDTALIDPDEHAEINVEATEDLPEDNKRIWTKKKRPTALNSSDEEADDDNTMNLRTTSSASFSGRIEGGTNTHSLAETAATVTNSEAPVRKKKKRNDEVEGKEHRSLKLERKEILKNGTNVKNKDELQKSINRDSRVIYAGQSRAELGYDKELEEFGIPTAKEFPKQRLLDEFNTRKLHCSDLDEAIKMMDVESVETILAGMDPHIALDELSRTMSLHKLLTTAYELKRGIASEPPMPCREEKTEKIIRIALALLPHDILLRQDQLLNTLLHGAINAEYADLVEYLLRMGSPVHIRNVNEMTAVESCVVVKRFDLLDMVLRYGGTFHHILSKAVGVVADVADHKALLAYMKRQGDGMRNIVEVTENHRKRVQEACNEVRKKIVGSQLRERELSPLISFPRSSLKYNGHQQTIQFMVPESWIARRDAKFMLVVIPVTYDNKRKIFIASSKKAPLRNEPYLCGRRCKSMTNRLGMFYRATSALRHHFTTAVCDGIHPKTASPEFAKIPSLELREQFVMNRIRNTSHPMLCSLSISFDQMSTFNFACCQLILYEPGTCVALPKAAARHYSMSDLFSGGSARGPQLHSQQRQ